MIKKRLNISTVCIALFFLLCFAKCENSNADIKNVNAKGLNVEEAINVNLVYTTGGNAKATLKAPQMLRIQDTTSYVEFPKKLHVDFYNAQAVIESILDAKYGKYNELQSKVLLKDSVRFIGLANGDTLYTNEMYWDRNRPTFQFYTDKPAVIKTKKEILFCDDGLEISQDFKEKLFHKVHNSFFRVPTAEFPNY